MAGTPGASAVRILHLADYGGPYPGSFVPMIRAAHAAVTARGWSFEAVFTPVAESRPWYARLRDDGIAVRARAVGGARAGAAAVRLLVGEAPGATVLHTHFSAWDVAAALAALREPRAALIWHVHTALVDRPSLRARNSLRFGLLGRRTARVLCVGPEVLADVLARRSPADRTLLFPNGIDLDRFAPVGDAQRAAARERLGIARGTRAVVAFTWDFEHKGGPLLLDALAQLRRDRAGVLLITVGGAPAVEAAARERGLSDAVRALEPRDDVREIYAAADVFAAASRAEGMPFSQLEALACGTPVVASDIPGHAFIGASLPGCRLAPRVPAAFAAAIAAELDDDPHRRRARLEATRAELARRVALGPWAHGLLDVYEQVVRERARP